MFAAFKKNKINQSELLVIFFFNNNNNLLILYFFSNNKDNSLIPYLCIVGQKPSNADFYLDTVEKVNEFLYTLA